MALLDRITSRIPEFCLSHWLLRIPLAIIFLQQGLSKLPVSIEDAESFGLPYLVWWVVSYGELGAGAGLLVGGILTKPWFPVLNKCYIPEVGDILTRFSGITICCIMTGVIWIAQPESLMEVILYDNLHVLLLSIGAYFAISGNK